MKNTSQIIYKKKRIQNQIISIVFLYTYVHVENSIELMFHV